jgi:hypothetical protein
MAVKTITQQLEEVQTAITAVLTGAQSYTIDGRTFTRANLDALQKREAYLMKAYKSEQGNRPVLTSMNISNMGYGENGTNQF